MGRMGGGCVSGDEKAGGRRPNLETHQCQINFQPRGIKEVWGRNDRGLDLWN